VKLCPVHLHNPNKSEIRLEVIDIVSSSHIQFTKYYYMKNKTPRIRMVLGILGLSGERFNF